jgi:predicted RNase H-like nuclease
MASNVVKIEGNSARARLECAFVGVDLGWYGKPSGLASIDLHGAGLSLRNVARIEGADQVVRWIQSEAGSGTCVVAVDAPLVIQNETGIRPAERELNQDFRRFHAGCHAANLRRPFAQKVTSFSSQLCEIGFTEGADLKPKQSGRFQIEVHPHAATINLFGLERIVKYKRGLRNQRESELRRLRELMLSSMPLLDPALTLQLPLVPLAGNLKPVEDQIDAVLCAYIGAHWWFWATERNRLYGSAGTGYIVVPHRYASA